MAETQSAEGLSRSAPELVADLARSKDEAFDCDVLIIGSGYGGAVAAARMAGLALDGETEAARIWILERGIERRPGRFPSRFSELPGFVRFSLQDGKPARGNDQGLFDLRIGNDVHVVLGSGLGGGSLVNAAVMMPPDASVFDDREHWPQDVNMAALEKHIKQAQRMLGATEPIPKEQETPKAALFDAIVTKQTDRADRCPLAINFKPGATSVAGVAMGSCTGCGDCVAGCNQGAKNSLDTNYLAQAWQAGVRMYCGSVVERLSRMDGNVGWNVHWHYTERGLRPDSGEASTLRARKVVLAAGSLGSTEILLRSRDNDKSGQLRFSDKLGQHFSMNGDLIMASMGHSTAVHCVGDQDVDPAIQGRRGVGPTIIGTHTVKDAEGKPLFMTQDSAAPAALRSVLSEIVTTLAVLDRGGEQPRSLPSGSDWFAATLDKTRHMAVYGAYGDDGAAGRLQLPNLQPSCVDAAIRIDWGGAGQLPLFKHMSTWLADAIKAIDPAAQLARSPDGIIDSYGAALPPVTVHPLGGCRMADTSAKGVVNHHGQVFDPSGANGGLYPDLAVVDGSIIPRALGVNPALTIAALAELAVQGLIGRWRLDKPAKAVPAKGLPQRPDGGTRRDLPAPQATWLLRETLHGQCIVDEQQYWVRLECRYAPITGFKQLLDQRRPVVEMAQGGRLTLERMNALDDRFSPPQSEKKLDQRRPPDCSIELVGGQLELFAPLNDNTKDQRVTLRYAMRLGQINGTAPPGWHSGDEMVGVKEFGKPPGAKYHQLPSPWRQLTELKLLHGNPGQMIGRLSLDTGDLAQRRQALLTLQSSSNMPDALDDLAAIGLYLARRASHTVCNALVDYYQPKRSVETTGLNLRYPGDITSHRLEVHQWPTTMRLSHYIPIGQTLERSDLTPVLLIHGMGTSGSSFTLESIGTPLAKYLLGEKRDVWVLDLQSSIGNAEARDSDEAASWTMEGIAEQDIPVAIDAILEQTKQSKVDVFGQCIGSAMFCFAALGTDKLQGKIRAAILSQVAPIVQLSPLNRLRGFLASYLEQFLRMETVDTHPDFYPTPNNTWAAGKARDVDRLVDSLLTTFPYLDDDQEASRLPPQAANLDVLRVRHRADTIFGQLFELRHVNVETLKRLDALMSWVRVPMLAQVIHFARHGMLMDARGRNRWLTSDKLSSNFNFPVLLLHGRKNRVFDWQGSLGALRLLRKVRGESEPQTQQRGEQDCFTRWGDGLTQLAVFDDYGHLDVLIGRQAHEHVYPVVEQFLKNADAAAAAAAAAARAEAQPPAAAELEPPWIGPMMGLPRNRSAHSGPRTLALQLLVKPPRRRALPYTLLLVPVDTAAQPWSAMLGYAKALSWHAAAAEPIAFELHLQLDALPGGLQAIAVFTLHDDAPLVDSGAQTPGLAQHETLGTGTTDLAAATKKKPEWLENGQPLSERAFKELKKSLGTPNLRLADYCVVLHPRCLDAQDIGQALDQPPELLSFSLASCQYPPGLFDAPAAQASYCRLLNDARSEAGPQFLVLCGDQVYLDATAGVFDPVSAAGPRHPAHEADLDRSYELNWRLPAFRRLSAQLPMMTILDDHELRNDWRPGDPELAAADIALRRTAYERFQNALNPVSAQRYGRYGYRCHPAGVPFFVLDTRNARQTDGEIPLDQRHIIDPAQLQELCGALKAVHPDQVKFIVTPVPLLPPDRLGDASSARRLLSDTWSGFPASVSMLMKGIRDNNIRRVVFLSGNSHLSSVSIFTFADSEGLQVVSVTSSGTYAPWPFANPIEEDFVLNGPCVLGLPGTISTPCISTKAGYAHLSLQRNVAEQLELQVELRASDGSTFGVPIPLH